MPEEVQATSNVARLSPEARAAVKAKKVEGRRKVKEWVRLLKELAAFDEMTDKLQSRAAWISGLGCVTLAVPLIVLFFIGVHASPDPAPTLAKVICYGLAAIGGLAFLAYLIRWWQMSHVDLANDFRASVAPLLEILAEDLPEKGKVAMELDMAGRTDAKQVSKGKIDPGRFKKVVETVWNDPWCHLAAPLADGSQLVLDIENQLISHARSWSKRSRSGKTKYKSKTKWKKLVVVSAAVVPNADHYQWDEGEISSRSAEEKIKLAEKKGAQVCRLVRKAKFSAVNQEPEETVPADEILGMFFELFKMLNPAEARS